MFLSGYGRDPGNGQQKRADIFVVPELELVVTFTSDYEGRSSIYWQLVNDIVAACDAP